VAHNVEQHIWAQPDEFVTAYRELRPIRHLDVEIRLDWRCNAKCKFCGVWKYSRDGMLTTERWKAVLDQLAEAGLEYTLFTGGEPLMYPHFDEVVGYVDALGIEASVITNGFLLTERKVRFLGGLHHLREVVVSIDSPNAEVHDSVRKLTGLFNRAMDGMARVRSLAPHVKLSMNTVVTAETFWTLRDLFTLPVLPDKIHLIPVGINLDWLDTLREVHENDWSMWAEEARHQPLTADNTAEVRGELARLHRLADERGILLESQRFVPDRPYQGSCAVPLAHFVIQPDGDVYPCCHVQDKANRIGELGKQTVGEMLGGEPYRAVLGRLRPVSLASCLRCARYRDFNERIGPLLETAVASPRGPG
jgi:radical SAM protein with 4Fe4S-binding SPASM domain